MQLIVSKLSHSMRCECVTRDGKPCRARALHWCQWRGDDGRPRSGKRACEKCRGNLVETARKRGHLVGRRVAMDRAAVLLAEAWSVGCWVCARRREGRRPYCGETQPAGRFPGAPASVYGPEAMRSGGGPSWIRCLSWEPDHEVPGMPSEELVNAVLSRPDLRPRAVRP